MIECNCDLIEAWKFTKRNYFPVFYVNEEEIDSITIWCEEMEELYGQV